ncbi:acylphosphatase [Algiphilus sp.]|uniref:acylphosphatase n=1 Tax=Algiphilus sp. TaxID=1872431 RepID=UPI0025C02CAB|nr:acylphosphatase [Algiphilus sp.]MCI5063137.1 acylphosphatase [Algiphilus sp.]MCI5102929.1 acylphosphatase [Algiphilus sp.]MCR9090254.1 acylphosphatase [Pseudomonadota bacterium]
MDETPAVYRFKVRGRVQGVSFRAFTAGEAERLGLQGWVANGRDGTVVGAAQGAPEALDALHQALHRGPPAARVDDVHWQAADALDISEAGFAIRPDVAG